MATVRALPLYQDVEVGTEVQNDAKKTAVRLLLDDAVAAPNGDIRGRIDELSVGYDPAMAFLPCVDGTITTGSLLRVRGWAVDMSVKGLAAGVFVRVNETLVEAEYGRPRADIAEYLDCPDTRYSGFECDVFVGDGNLGAANVQGLVLNADTRWFSQLENSLALDIVRGSLEMQPRIPEKPDAGSICVDSVELSGRVVQWSQPSMTIRRGSTVTMKGWARDTLADAAARGIYAIVDGTDFFRGLMGQPRPDVAQIYGERSLPSGFTISFCTDRLVVGSHELWFAAVAADGRGYCRCGDPISLEIESAGS